MGDSLGPPPVMATPEFHPAPANDCPQPASSPVERKRFIFCNTAAHQYDWTRAGQEGQRMVWKLALLQHSAQYAIKADGSSYTGETTSMGVCLLAKGTSVQQLCNDFVASAWGELENFVLTELQTLGGTMERVMHAPAADRLAACHEALLLFSSTARRWCGFHDVVRHLLGYLPERFVESLAQPQLASVRASIRLFMESWVEAVAQLSQLLMGYSTQLLSTDLAGAWLANVALYNELFLQLQTWADAAHITHWRDKDHNWAEGGGHSRSATTPHPREQHANTPYTFLQMRRTDVLHPRSLLLHYSVTKAGQLAAAAAPQTLQAPLNAKAQDPTAAAQSPSPLPELCLQELTLLSQRLWLLRAGDDDLLPPAAIGQADGERPVTAPPLGRYLTGATDPLRRSGTTNLSLGTSAKQAPDSQLTMMASCSAAARAQRLFGSPSMLLLHPPPSMFQSRLPAQGPRSAQRMQRPDSMLLLRSHVHYVYGLIMHVARAQLLGSQLGLTGRHVVLSWHGVDATQLGVVASTGRLGRTGSVPTGPSLLPAKRNSFMNGLQNELSSLQDLTMDGWRGPLPATSEAPVGVPSRVESGAPSARSSPEKARGGGPRVGWSGPLAESHELEEELHPSTSGRPFGHPPLPGAFPDAQAGHAFDGPRPLAESREEAPLSTLAPASKSYSGSRPLAESSEELPASTAGRPQSTVPISTSHPEIQPGPAPGSSGPLAESQEAATGLPPKPSGGAANQSAVPGADREHLPPPRFPLVGHVPRITPDFRPLFTEASEGGSDASPSLSRTGSQELQRQKQAARLMPLPPPTGGWGSPSQSSTNFIVPAATAGAPPMPVGMPPMGSLPQLPPVLAAGARRLTDTAWGPGGLLAATPVGSPAKGAPGASAAAMPNSPPTALRSFDSLNQTANSLLAPVPWVAVSAAIHQAASGATTTALEAHQHPPPDLPGSSQTANWAVPVLTIRNAGDRAAASVAEGPGAASGAATWSGRVEGEVASCSLTSTVWRARMPEVQKCLRKRTIIEESHTGPGGAAEVLDTWGLTQQTLALVEDLTAQATALMAASTTPEAYHQLLAARSNIQTQATNLLQGVTNYLSQVPCLYPTGTSMRELCTLHSDIMQLLDAVAALRSSLRQQAAAMRPPWAAPGIITVAQPPDPAHLKRARRESGSTPHKSQRSSFVSEPSLPSGALQLQQQPSHDRASADGSPSGSNTPSSLPTPEPSARSAMSLTSQQRSDRLNASIRSLRRRASEASNSSGSAPPPGPAMRFRPGGLQGQGDKPGGPSMVQVIADTVVRVKSWRRHRSASVAPATAITAGSGPPAAAHPASLGPAYNGSTLTATPQQNQGPATTAWGPPSGARAKLVGENSSGALNLSRNISVASRSTSRRMSNVLALALARLAVQPVQLRGGLLRQRRDALQAARVAALEAQLKLLAGDLTDLILEEMRQAVRRLWETSSGSIADRFRFPRTASVVNGPSHGAMEVAERFLKPMRGALSRCQLRTRHLLMAAAFKFCLEVAEAQVMKHVWKLPGRRNMLRDDPWLGRQLQADLVFIWEAWAANPRDPAFAAMLSGQPRVSAAEADANTQAASSEPPQQPQQGSSTGLLDGALLTAGSSAAVDGGDAETALLLAVVGPTLSRVAELARSITGIPRTGNQHHAG